MEEVIINTLRIPMSITFEESFSLDMQVKTIEIIERLTIFCVKYKNINVNILIANLAGDMDLSMNTFRDVLAKHDFGQEFGFMDPIDIFLCTENISVDETSKYCISIDEVEDEQKIINAFERVLDCEVKKRLKRQEKKWDLRSLRDIFKNSPAADKRLADGLFMSQRYKEAYKIYSRYKDADEFSYYCVEMSVYCLLLSRKPVPLGILDYMRRSEFKLGIYLIRLTVVTLALNLDILTLKLSSILEPTSLLRALVQGKLSKSFNGSDYLRKRIEAAFNSALVFNDAGFHSRFIECAGYFLELVEAMNIDEKNAPGCIIGRDILFLDYPIKYIRSIFKVINAQTPESAVLDIIESKTHEAGESVEIFRKYKGSVVDFQKSMNTKESIFLRCSREGHVCVLDMENNSLRSYNTNTEISFNQTGNFLIRNLLFHKAGVEWNLEINRIVEVGENLPFMHIDTEESHEVYCGEEYSFICKVVRNYKSAIEVTFNGDKFTANADVFTFTVIFPSTGIFDVELELESNGIKAHQRISFIIVPSFSVSLFHYKYCLPLVFLKICNHTTEDARVRSFDILNQDFEISGIDTIKSVYSYRESAIKYFRENIIGVNSAIVDLGHQGEKNRSRMDSYQEIFNSMERSSPVVSDLFFRGLVKEVKEDVVLPNRRSCFVRLFLEKKESFSGSTLDLGYTGHESNPQVSQVDRMMVYDSRFCFISRNKENFPNLSFDTTLPYESPIKVEIELSSKRICSFILGGLLNELSLGSIEMTSKSTSCAEVFRPLIPFIYITHSSPIRLNEPTIMYLCVSNYYEHSKLTIELSSHNIIICDDDRVLDSEKFSFSLFEIRSIFPQRKKYGTEDLRIQIRVDGEEINYEGLIDLPFAM